MIKRTLHFGNPVYLSTKHEQLVVSYPEHQNESKTVPIEDVGVIVLEHAQITITNALMSKLMLNNVVIVHCNAQHMPQSMTLSLYGHSEFNERIRHQLNVSVPLKKNLWQQTVERKIANQAHFLQVAGNASRKEVDKLHELSRTVLSGDTQNNEGQAAAIYWNKLFGIEGFTRGRKDADPNNLLNYGYAILRAVCARALVGSGMLPGYGIFHANKYNPYCLADDIMEPYRPYVDAVVWDILKTTDDYSELTPELKKQLLMIPALDVVIDGKKSPLLVAMSRTTSSLSDCFAGVSRKLNYPDYGSGSIQSS
jgi:CRISP-associated protein Cas1